MGRWVFLGWSLIGWCFLLTNHLPKSLSFTTGFFLVFYGLSVLELERTRIGNWKRVLPIYLGIGCLGFLLEVIGSKTGVLFGRYHYTSFLGSMVLGVPYPMAFAWLGVVGNANLISSQVSRILRALEIGMWVVWMDVVLDPVALTRHFWVWDQPGIYYGIPLQNYIGWFGAAAGLSFLLPLKEVPRLEKKWAIRLFQWMLMLFALLAMEAKEGVAVFIALLGMVAIEGRHTRDFRQLKRLV